MTRIVIGLIVALALCSCTSTGGDKESNDAPDAKSVKAEMDAEAKDLLPDLATALGGTFNGMQATFYERGGFGVWDYTASGTVLGLPGTDEQALSDAAATLEGHGFTVESDAEAKSLRGRKGNVSVTMSSAFPDDDRGVPSLNFQMSSAEPISEGDDFAEAAPAEDYLAFVE